MYNLHVGEHKVLVNVIGKVILVWLNDDTRVSQLTVVLHRHGIIADVTVSPQTEHPAPVLARVQTRVFVVVVDVITWRRKC